MIGKLLLIMIVLVLAITMAVLLVRKVQKRRMPSLKMDFRKAKEHERRKNRDLSAYP